MGLAEERTEEFPKRATFSHLTRVSRQNSADFDPPRLRKYSWRKRCARLSIFPWRSILLNHHLICWCVGFVEQCFWNICFRHHHKCDGEKEVGGRKSSCPRMAEEHGPLHLWETQEGRSRRSKRAGNCSIEIKHNGLRAFVKLSNCAHLSKLM